MRTTISKSEVMTRAWQLVKNQGLKIKQALAKAWKECKLALLKELLRHGFVFVTFRKADGSVTTRLATRNTDFVPEAAKPKNTGIGANAEVIPFYSETDAGWRLFKADSLVSFKVA